MTKNEAISRARTYAETHGIAWGQLCSMTRKPNWWYFGTRSHSLVVETGDGRAEIIASLSLANADGIHSFEYYPDVPGKAMLPPWIAYPGFTSVTIGWRMSYGELYWWRWHDWFLRLDADGRSAYKQRYPPPDDDRCWQGFYEMRSL